MRSKYREVAFNKHLISKVYVIVKISTMHTKEVGVFVIEGSLIFFLCAYFQFCIQGV